MRDKVIWITGASSGIGEELAKQYAKRGSKLILSARRKEELERVRSSCLHQDNIKIVPLDLTDFSGLPQKVEEAKECFGAIYLLINN